MPRLGTNHNMCSLCFCLFFRVLTDGILLIIIYCAVFIFVDSFLHFLQVFQIVIQQIICIHVLSASAFLSYVGF